MNLNLQLLFVVTPLWIIWEDAKPRCFKNVKLAWYEFYEYKTNNRAWMAGELFQEYAQ